ncbi:MAG: hypothetical protein M3291_05215 [Actinomycetota bacterium]|nr:hypothetical protein [Actinomycetota bacterium]
MPTIAPGGALAQVAGVTVMFNGVYSKVTGDPKPFMYCIDDPNDPTFIDPGGGS